MIKFTVVGQPVAKGRARSAVRGGFVRHYTPAKTVAYEKMVAIAATSAMAGQPQLDGPVVLSVRAYMAIPESWSKKKRAAALAGDILPTSKPDMDNVIKAIKDGLNSIVWRDDAQVVEYYNTGKRYSDTPRVEIEVSQYQASKSAMCPAKDPCE